MSRVTDKFTKSSEYYTLNKGRIWSIGAIFLFIILCFSLLFITKTVMAQKRPERIKLVACVEIERGDTLWNIAAEYITDEYTNMNEYIREIKDSNGLIEDEIHTGNYLIIPYYSNVSSYEGIINTAMAEQPQ